MVTHIMLNKLKLSCGALLVLLALLVLGSTQVCAQSRLPITISNTALPAATLTDYTVRLDLNATNAPGFDFANNGDDIIAWNADTTAQLDFYVEDVDAVAQTAVVWVRVPSVAPSPPDTHIFLDYNRMDVVTPLSDASATFVNNGFKYHSQPHTAAAPGPETQAAGEAEFNFNEVTSNANYGCTQFSSINVDHSGAFVQNGDFGLSISAHMIIPADALYEFRIGTDFGSGGSLTVDGVALEEDWTNDLWWANNFGNADVLQGATFLTAGSHTLRVLGYERCCDGPARLQYRYDSDGDGSLADETFSDLTTASAGLTLLAPSCPTAQVTIGSVTTVPVTLAKFSSRKLGPYLKLEWETADETFNAGFNLWVLQPDESGNEQLMGLNKRLVRSRTFDSIDTQRYQRTVNVRRYPGLKKVAISSVDINGVQEFFGPFELDQTYGESFEPQPIDWQAVHAEFTQRMRQRGFERQHERWVRVKQEKQRRDSGRVQLGVAVTGVYRVTYEDLLAQGLDLAGVPRRQIAVTTDGQPVPRVMRTRQRGVFGPGGTIDFVGVAPDDRLAIYQPVRFYQIQLDVKLARSARVLKRKPKSAKDWHYRTQKLEHDNRHLIFSPLDTPWVMDLVFRTSEPAGVQYAFDVSSQLPNPTSLLEVVLGGIANAPLQDFDADGQLDPHHRFSIWVNEQRVETLSFDGQRSLTTIVKLPAGILRTGNNTVEIRVENSGYDFDVAVVDSVSLSYPVANQTGGSLSFSERTESHDGFVFKPERRRGLLAYVYRDDHNLMRLKPSRAPVRGRYQVASAGQGAHRYFIGHAADLMRPATIRLLPEWPELNLSDSDLLIISHPHFIGDALNEYVAARRLQGVFSQIIDTDAIAHHFGPDVPLHIAIQRFLKNAAQRINYEHVLLVGGHTFDYLGRQNKDNLNFIPSFYRPIGSSRFTPTDQPFVDFDGDGFPEKSIGRWPVRQLKHLEVIVDKSIAWAEGESLRTQSGHGVLLLADKVREFEFDDDLDAHFGLISGVQLGTVDRVYVDRVSAELGASYDLNREVQQRVMNGFSADKSWVFYNGHGSPNAWSFSQMLSASRVSELGNVDAPVLITSLGCYTTYYESPTHNSLALQLLFAGNNAAVGITGPSVVGGYLNQLKLSNLIAQEIKSGQSIGGSIKAGMRRLPINYRTAISNWALLADPSLPVQ